MKIKHISLSLIFIIGTACTKQEKISIDPIKEQVVTVPKKEGKAIAENQPPNFLEQIKNIKKSDFSKQTDLLANVVGVYVSQLGFQTDGYIKKIYIRNGQKVKKGELLAILDESLLKEQVRNALFNLDQQKNTEYFARLTYNRTKALDKRQATTQVLLEQAESSWKNGKIAIDQYDSLLNIAKINLSYAQLIAPFDGVVFNLNNWEGDYVSATNIILTLVSNKELEIQMSVPQTIENTFAVGDKYPFTSAGKKTTGIFNVKSIVPYIDPTSKNYLVIGYPSNTSKELMAGESILIKYREKL